MTLLPRIVPLGEEAITVGLGTVTTEAVHEKVRSLAHLLETRALAGVLEICPAYTTVTVRFDPDLTGVATLEPIIRAMLEGPLPFPAEQSGAAHEIPVRYDGVDLEVVAERAGMSPREVVERHTAREYRVYLIGFVPGFPYLGDLDTALVMPRRPQPRPRVPPGSVAIAGAQTGIYPFATPGGWHLIGSTPVVLFDPARKRPSLLAAGDRVRFVERS
ncbi:MAG: 5-oxoprolinase subunit PxpB [Gemmatimonadota bacterium]